MKISRINTKSEYNTHRLDTKLIHRHEYFQQIVCKEHNKRKESDNSSDELYNKFSGYKKDSHNQCIVYDHAVIERQPDESIKSIMDQGIRSMWCGIQVFREWLNTSFFDCCCFGYVVHSPPCSQGNYSDTWITASIKGKHDLNNINTEEWFKSITEENTQNDVLNFNSLMMRKRTMAKATK